MDGALFPGPQKSKRPKLLFMTENNNRSKDETQNTPAVFADYARYYDLLYRDKDYAVRIKRMADDQTEITRLADIEFEYLRSLSTLILSEEDFLLLRKRERRIAVDIEREGTGLNLSPLSSNKS